MIVLINQYFNISFKINQSVWVTLNITAVSLYYLFWESEYAANVPRHRRIVIITNVVYHIYASKQAKSREEGIAHLSGYVTLQVWLPGSQTSKFA